MVALVDHDQPVAVEQCGFVAAGEALDHRDVDGPGGLVAPAADLADGFGIDVEVVGES